MKRNTIIAIVIILIAVAAVVIFYLLLASKNNMGGGMGDGQPTTFKTITAEQAKKMMDGGNVTIVDVRRQDEYDAGHIKDAVLVPNEQLSDIAESKLPDKNAVLLIYCRSGSRSRVASQKLVELGYLNVYNFGGIIDWPYDIVK